ncbi:MAG: TAT-variant-translocated molybdopterin oxidoreductase, partial [Verrucomicrobiales bacterium]
MLWLPPMKEEMDNEFKALEGKTGSGYWKSLDDLADTPAFQEWAEREFPQGASELQGFNRRHFMKIMAASFGLAGVGLTGCRRPKHEILPYVQQPENIIPGVPQFYSSSRPTPWENVPVVVETHQARPTKIEGNPSYLAAGGGTDSFTQASVLDLYDPARAKRNVQGTKTLDRAAVLDLLANWSSQMGANKGAGFAFLAERSTSPSRRALVADLKKKYPQAIWAEYEPLDYSAADRASVVYWGEPVRVINDYSKARRVVSVGGDFLGMDPGSTESTRSFSRARKVDDPKKAKEMNRLYVVEGDFSLTGAMADHRLRLSASQHEALLTALAQELLSLGAQGNGDISGLVRGLPVDEAVPLDWVQACAKDLHENQGQSVLVVSPGAAERIQWLAFFINELIGAPGHTQRLLKLPKPEAQSITDLAQELKSGKVETLFILGGNPVYNAPADLDWPLIQQQAGEVVRFGYWNDETSASTGTNLLLPHYLESWSDGETLDGTLVPVQPMIEPLMDSFDELEILATLLGRSETDPYTIVQETFAKRSGSGGAGFDTFLAVGVLPESGYDEIKPSTSGSAVVKALNANPAPASGVISAKNLEVLFTPSSHTFDGRYANNGWMMECPDSMTKLTWDNAILISPRLAKELQKETGLEIFQSPNVMTDTDQLQRNSAQFKRGKEQALMAVLTVNGTELHGPIHVLPGLANYTVVVPVGFGRDVSGPVGQGVGFNAYPAMPSTNRWSTTGASIELTDEVYPLANTQEHWSMEGRALMREGTVAEFAESPDFVAKMGMESHSPPVYG